MISAGLAVEGHAHGLGLPGHPPYVHMTYPESWRSTPQSVKPATEFLRPAPKPLAAPTRYNGLNGTQRSLVPVNLTQSQALQPPSVKDDVTSSVNSRDDLTSASYYQRMYQSNFPGLQYPTNVPPYCGLYSSPYSPLLRPSYVQPPPLSPLESTFPPSVTSVVKSGQSVLREKRPVPSTGFKVPCGKEGSLKHRILTRPPGAPPETPNISGRKRLPGSTLSPPATPTSTKPTPTLNTNNNTVPGNFTKGSLIQLATGELRRVEDMRTEDFVLSAEKSPELRLAESTVVRIDENSVAGTANITLSYNQNRTQVEFEATLEHPFFVYGQGWASCNPERTLQYYGLKVHRLQVGDILVSLTPREPAASSSTKSSTVTTTATTTAMTARQVSRAAVSHVDRTLLPPPPAPAPHSSELLDATARKRRWSAPDQICDDNEQAIHKRQKD